MNPFRPQKSGQWKDGQWKAGPKAALFLGKALGIILGLLCIAVLGGYFYISNGLPSANALKSTEGLHSLFSDDYQQARQQVVLIPFHEIPPQLVKACIAANVSPDVDGALSADSDLFTHIMANRLLYRQKTRYDHLDALVMRLNIELALSREEIVSAWMSVAFWGKGTYGVSAAAQKYYGKPLTGLTICESAQLAATSRAPLQYNPLDRPEQAKEEQQRTLDKMVRLGLASEADVAACRPECVKRGPGSVVTRCLLPSACVRKPFYSGQVP